MLKLWGEAAPQAEGSSVCAQQSPARLGFPGALPQRRVVWMWFGAFPGAFGGGAPRDSELPGTIFKCSESTENKWLKLTICNMARQKARKKRVCWGWEGYKRMLIAVET